MACTRYFLGGNTAAGFCSFYSSFCSGPEDFIWVLKGGPGCGKSSFMKTVGRAAEDADDKGRRNSANEWAVAG